MKRFKAIAGITMIFLLGVMTGVLGTGMVVKHRIESFHSKGFPPIKPIFMKKVCSRLDLTPAQKSAVEKILENLHVQLKEARHEFHPKIKAAFDNSFAQIRTHLSEPQQKKLDTLIKQLPRHFPPGKKHRRSHGLKKNGRDKTGWDKNRRQKKNPLRTMPPNNERHNRPLG